MEYFNKEKTGCGLKASKPGSVKHGFKGTKEMVSHRENPTAVDMKTVAQYIVMFLQIKQPTDFMGL